MAVVNQDFGRYPLSARENVAFRNLSAGGLSGDFATRARMSSACAARSKPATNTLVDGGCQPD